MILLRLGKYYLWNRSAWLYSAAKERSVFVSAVGKAPVKCGALKTHEQRDGEPAPEVAAIIIGIGGQGTKPRVFLSMDLHKPRVEVSPKMVYQFFLYYLTEIRSWNWRTWKQFLC